MMRIGNDVMKKVIYLLKNLINRFKVCSLKSINNQKEKNKSEQQQEQQV
jgi:hypothetical protein